MIKDPVAKQEIKNKDRADYGTSRMRTCALFELNYFDKVLTTEYHAYMID